MFRVLTVIWNAWPACRLSGMLVISAAGAWAETSPWSIATQRGAFWNPSCFSSLLSSHDCLPVCDGSFGSSWPTVVVVACPGGGCPASWALTIPITPSSAPATTATTSTRRRRKLEAIPPSLRDDRDGSGPGCGICRPPFSQRGAASRKAAPTGRRQAAPRRGGRRRALPAPDCHTDRLGARAVRKSLAIYGNQWGLVGSE